MKYSIILASILSLLNFMIKRFFHIFLVSALLLFCTSSCKPEEVVQPELIVAKEEIPFTKNAGSILLAIKTNVKWRASSNESWCTLSPASGEAGSRQIAVWVTENTSVAVREAIITITAGSLSKQVKVIQAQKVVFTISQKEFNVPGQGGEITVTIQASQDFTTAIQAAWITQKSISADKKTQIFTVAENDLDSLREGTITFTSGSMTEIVSVRQTTKDFSIPPDKTGMESDSKVLAKKINLGWNLGNTLEAIGGETAWGNPKASKTLIDLVKASGFNAVRIPCAWDQYLENQTTYKIKDLWLARVKEVVDYCIENDMYVILNIHWDGGWLENNPTPDKQAEVNKKQKAIWEQIALYFRNYDERLLFAGTNEVHTTSGNPTQANFDVQMSYNQTFVDAVRFTGGKNAYRNLIIQAYNTNIDQAVAYLKISTDYVPDRLMVEVHHYDPWNFCGLEKDETWGKYAALWGQPYEQYAIGVLAGRAATWGKEDYLKTQFNKIKTSFVDKGYPVILGEYGVIRRTTYSGDALMHHLDSRAYYLRYVTEQAKNYGLIPFYWDNGSTGNLAFGIIDRKTNRIADEKALNALIEGSVAGTYPY